MLPDATRHRWAFVLADEVIATAMLNAYGWDALETYLPKSVDKGIDSLTMPNDTWCQARCDVLYYRCKLHGIVPSVCSIFFSDIPNESRTLL